MVASSCLPHESFLAPNRLGSQEKTEMLLSVEGFWIAASIFGDGTFSQSYFQFYEPPGQDIYATIALSRLDHYPGDADHFVSAYIARWTVYGPDGKLFAPEPNSMGRAQNAIGLRNCASLEFELEVTHWVTAAAQINIFKF
jgi:hypothetical protein